MSARGVENELADRVFATPGLSVQGSLFVHVRRKKHCGIHRDKFYVALRCEMYFMTSVSSILTSIDSDLC